MMALPHNPHILFIKAHLLKEKSMSHSHCSSWRIFIYLLFGIGWLSAAEAEGGDAHTLTFGGRRGEEFLLDGKPFQMLGGEMHPNRIPRAYWRHRIRMAKACGLNTVPIYVFWNDHEREEGRFDFSTGNRDIGEFLRIVGEEGLWVVLRPGPYVCGEWDLGGIPPRLLRYPDIKLRTNEDARYVRAVEKYIHALAEVVRPYMAGNGGPILMVQIENEYSNYQRRDPKHLAWLRDLWMKEGIRGPFCTSDGFYQGVLEEGLIAGAAAGLNGVVNEEHWKRVRKVHPGVPIFSAETYPGWLRHWGEGDFKPTDVVGQLKFFMDNRKSFNLYVFHGGTNFGFSAGANDGGPGKYEPDVTSYDYAAPVDEQGRATGAYHAIRKLLGSYLPVGARLPDVPPPIAAAAMATIPMERWTSLWDHLPTPVEAKRPVWFEALGQNQGIVVYRTQLSAGGKGKLFFERLNDYGQVFLDGKHLGTLDRRKGEREIDVPEVGPAGAVLDVLVEGLGHINYNITMEQDRKGILGAVKLGDAVLTEWQMFLFPLDEAWAAALPKSSARSDRPGGIFRGRFTLDALADTFLDMSEYQKGYVWVNGHNLGRYWRIGPQKRLYCPAPWLKKGANEIVVFDLHQTEARPIASSATGR
jgi:hypothetical protein